MYREKLVECADCGDRFKIVYDSKKEHQDKYTCKCSKLVCYPDYFGSYSYDRGGRYNKIPYEEQENKYEYYEEDYIRLTEEEQRLLNEIDEIALIFGKEYSSPYSNRSDEEDIRLELSGCSKSNEGLTIFLEVRLQSWGYPWSDRDVKEKHERILTGLNRFKEVILKVKNSEINLDNPRKIWDDDSCEWYDSIKTQQKLYDYELYC
jgi:hypothetical protein